MTRDGFQIALPMHKVGQRAGTLVRTLLLSLATVLAIAGSMRPAAAQAPVLSMSFGAPTIGVGDTTTLSFRIKNNSSRVARLVTFGDSLPAGLIVATPPRVINSCGGVVSANPGGSLFQVSGVALSPRSSCTVSVNVTATSAGVKYNMTTAVTSVVASGNGASTAIRVYAPSTSLASISPTGGTTLGGTRVTITGTNLAGATAVMIGGVAAQSFTVVDANTITAITPAHDAGAVDVVVWTPRGAATGKALYSYDSLVPAVVLGGAVAAGIAAGIVALSSGGTETPPLRPNVPAAPTVTSVNPSAGPILGGSSATITGTNLTGATTVKIGGVSTSNFTVVNATTITAIAPAHARHYHRYRPNRRDRGVFRRHGGDKFHHRQRQHHHRDDACACGGHRRCRSHDIRRYRNGDGALHLCDARSHGDVNQPG